MKNIHRVIGADPSDFRHSESAELPARKDEGISEELITHVADRLGHDRRYGIDPTKIKEDLGWYPETPFEKGIVLTIDWYLAHPDWMAHVTSGDYQKYYEQMYKNK